MIRLLRACLHYTKYCMLELFDLALGQRIKAPSFDLNVEPLNSLDVDERSTQVVKVADAQHHAQLLATFFYGQLIRVYSCKCNETAGHIKEAQ